MSACALGALSFDKIVDSLCSKSFWKGDDRHMDSMKTEGAVAVFTIEMNMLVVKRALVVALTNLIACLSGAVLDGMNEMMCQ